MKKSNSTKTENIDAKIRARVTRNLAFAIEQRLNHPKVTISGENAKTVASRVSQDLEESCYKVGQESGYLAYKGSIIEFMVHISPYFKTARHSMLFRDMMVNAQLRNEDGSIPDRINVAKASKEELWPEIYANDYLNVQEKQDILELRSVELGIAALIFSRMVKSDEVQLKMDVIADTQQKVCFGQSNQCWTIAEPQINLPCLQDGTCEIPELRSCMKYEDFLKHFAAHGMKGNVSNPADPDKVLNTATTTRVRRIWSKEIKMTRVYLDILETLTQTDAT